MKYQITTLIGCALALSVLNAEDKPGAERPGAGPGGKPDGSFFRSMDKDDDKAISKEEAGDKWERLGKLDKNSDGKVDMREMMAARPGGGEPGSAPGAGRPDGDRPGPGEMFKRSDKNNDGKVTSDEVPAEAWERISKLDKNSDGAVSAEELRAGGPAGPGGPGGPGGGQEMFGRADKNKDGKISKDEVPAEMWERLSKLDKDSDGSVSKEEARFLAQGGPGGPGGGGEMFARADKNNDGKLSKDEVPAEMWERVSKLDKDGDSLITKDEMAAMMKDRMGAEGKRGGLGGGPGEGGSGAMFSRFDTDKDGKLSKTEVPAEMWDKLSKADDDADGLISKGELEKIYNARDGGGPRPDKKPEGDGPKEKPAEADKTAA